MSHGALLIDQRSASLTASDQDLPVWGRGRRVFVSSLIGDMRAERAAVREAIERLGAMPVMFEDDLGAQDISAEQAYLRGVRSSEIYIGLFGPRYGVRMPDGDSATHAELREAETNGLRLCLFVNGETSGEMDRAQRDLIDGARNLYTTSPWSDPDDLGQRVERRLREIASEELAPWVRVGRTVFRAKELSTDGQSISISADVLSSAVHTELVGMRDARASVTFTSPSEARQAQVAALSTRTVSTARHEENLTLTVQETSSFRMSSSVNGVSADEILRRSLSDGLFGTNQLGDMAGWGSQPIDPFAEIRGAALDDAVLRPVARLLFAERMLLDGIAARVDAFTLGPSHQGSRRLRAVWTPRRVYVNEPDPKPTSIDGVVTGL
ncbi:DUF4062 domain-containing protein [Microbacterium oxydans]|uniref:DUF4062 domain-containing protein n=1 Tax=Microbacterium oxydans TaxID=82380 RepID=A0A0F0LC25_9MICO|nr:DUF4062 domain-containing protein [Microbacterium oxydans]KJL30224.1 hypothetical protein RS83_00974 [Microbacterium oxydans]